MIRVFCLAILLCLSAILNTLKSQSCFFDVMLFGSKIGEMKVTKKAEKDGIEKYTVSSNSSAKILWITRHVTSELNVTYKDGKLQSSNFKEIENGKMKRWTNIECNSKECEIDSYKGKKTLKEVPSYSLANVYFKDGKGLSKIFYEAEGDFSPIIQANKNIVEYKTSDGIHNYYYFENGQIKSMEYHLSIANVKMVRR